VYAIYRHKAAKNAWYWIVTIRRRAERFERCFYDQSLGGSRKALVAAIAWSDQRLSKQLAFTMREFHELKRANNTIGVPGVFFLQPSASRRDGGWAAYVRFSNGKGKSRTFSIRKYGEPDAFARAVAARDELLELVDDKPYLKNRTAKQFATATKHRLSEHME
jgi:hypothetical protein